MSDTGFARYVAIGDSQTEGLWDGDDSSGVVGFADRLAATLDSLYPGLMYANLAVPARFGWRSTPPDAGARCHRRSFG